MTEAEQQAAVLEAMNRHIIGLEIDLVGAKTLGEYSAIMTRINEAHKMLKVVYKAFSTQAAGGAA